MNLYHIATVFIIGYLLGSIPFAVIISRYRGINIFKAGSGNPGATNVKRVVGKTEGNICFSLDVLKGFIAAIWPVLTFFNFNNRLDLCIFGLVGAIIGHSYSVFLSFRGGKGVAVTMGGLIAIMPLVLISGIVVWLIVFFTTKYVSLGSIFFGISLPISAFIFNYSTTHQILAISLALIILIRHFKNIRNLFLGIENKFYKTK